MYKWYCAKRDRFLAPDVMINGEGAERAESRERGLRGLRVERGG